MELRAETSICKMARCLLEAGFGTGGSSERSFGIFKEMIPSVVNFKRNVRCDAQGEADGRDEPTQGSSSLAGSRWKGRISKRSRTNPLDP